MRDSQGFFGFNNQAERTAAERGYDLYGFYENRDDAEHLVSQLHGSKVHAFKLYKTLLQGGYNIRGWVVYVKTADLYKLRDDYRPPEKVKKPEVIYRNGRRKDMARKIYKMRKEDNMEWEDIAKELERSVSTVQYYFYHYSSKKCREKFTDWQDERRPEGYDPETGLIRKESKDDKQTT